MTDETQAARLPAERLYRKADLSHLDFSTTADLDPAEGLVGQERALDAIRFGTQVDRDGFNLFVIGPHGARMQEAVKELLAEEKRDEPQPAPSDWVYVNNFQESEKPVAIEMPGSRARNFQRAMDQLIEDLKSALPAVFQSEEYQTRKGAIDEQFQNKQNEAFSELREKASQKNIVILRTPMGFSLAPSQDGKVVPPEEFNNWPEEQREEVKQTIQELEKELEHIVNQIPQCEKERREELRKLNRETASYAVDQLIEETKETFSDLPKVLEHIDAVRDHIVENVETFVQNTEGEKQGQMPETRAGSPFDQYKVNVLVSQSDTASQTPIVEEFHPTLSNLIGRIEHVPVQGALITNFLLIKAGAMHRANGG
jgi:predicted ATP-dependent protease